jgi:molecular chaperone Hsp33
VVHEDTVLRAMTDDGAFRVIAADTTATVRGAIAAQEIAPESPELVRTFADLLTGAVLVRESMAPDNRLQAVLQGDDPRQRMVADTHPDGSTRGLVQLPPNTRTMPLGERGLLQIARTLHNGSLHQGVVQVPSGTVSSAFMAYMQESEQVVTVIAVGAHLAAGEVVAAGGYMVQLLPEVAEGPLMVMTERLKNFEDIVPLLARGAAAPEALLAETLYGMPYTKVGERTVQFGCNCSPERLAVSLASLPRADIASLMEGGKTLDIQCDYCRKNYQFTIDQLRGLLEPKN